VLIEPDRQRVDLALQLAQTPGQPVALLAEGLGQGDHRIDEPAFTFVCSRDLVHGFASGARVRATRSKRDAAAISRERRTLGPRACRGPDRRDVRRGARITCAMPIYEYECGDCRRRVSLLIRTISAAAEAACPRCGGANLTRLMSRFATVKSEDARLESLADSSAMGDLDENDPGSVARFMKKMGREFGEDMGEDFDSAVDEAMAEGEGEGPPAGESSAESVDASGGSEL
jgi:putative FmdB family regulatory protein